MIVLFPVQRSKRFQDHQTNGSWSTHNERVSKYVLAYSAPVDKAVDIQDVDVDAF